MGKKINRILIARTDRLGDVVLSTPVIKFLREKHPDAYIAFMLSTKNADVVKNDPRLDEVILYDKRGEHKSVAGTVKLAMTLREKKFDIGLALHPDNRTHIMMFLAGIPVRIGYDRKWSVLLTKRIKHLKQEGRKHESEYNFDMLAGCGYDVSGADRHPYIVTGAEDKMQVDSLLAAKKISGGMIALHPGASCPSKRWPPEMFAEVADELSARYGMHVILLGGREASRFSDLVASEMKERPCDLTGMLSVGALAEMLSRCRLFISNDSGPVHVSVAVNTPVIAIFGRKSPGLSPLRWGPLGKKDVVIHRDAGCDICLAHNCEKDFACIKAVKPEDVLRIVSEGKFLD